MRSIKCAAVAVLLACGMVRAEGVMDVMPQNGLVQARVANLTATSNKVAKLAKDLGIDAFVAQLQNPLANLKAQYGMEKGVNDAGEFGWVFLDPAAAAAARPDESIVVLVPVSNYAEFLTNFQDAKADGAVSQVTVPMVGDKPVFVAEWGGYAALSHTKTLVATKPAQTMKVDGAAAAQAAKQDVLVLANFKALSPLLLPKLEEGRAEAYKKFDADDSKEIDPKYKPLIRAAMTQAFAASQAFLDGTDAATIGLNISDAGLNATVLSSFKAGSYLGGVAGSIKGSDKPLTVGLPAIKYLFYGGAAVDAAPLTKVFTDLTSPIEAEFAKLEGQDEAKKLVTSAKASFAKMQSVTFGAPVPAAVGKEALLQSVSITRGGGADIKTFYTEGANLGKKLLADFKPPEGGIKPTLQYAANAKTIEGVSLDSLKVEMKTDPDAPNGPQMEQMQSLLYGPDGLNYQYGTVGTDDFVIANGATDATIGAFIKAAKANEDNVSKLDPVKAVTNELPKTRSAEYFIALDEIVNLGVTTAGQFGLPVQVQLPPDLPPLGVTFGAEGTALRFDVHVPTTTVQSLIAAGMQAYMGMRGGGGGGL